MKSKAPQHRNLILAAVTVAVTSFATSSALAQSKSWVGNGNQTFPTAIWGGNANWTPSGPANGTGNTATFGNSFNNGYACIVNTARTIGNIVFNDPANANDLILRTHVSDFTLTLDVTSGLPSVDVAQAGRTLIIEPRVAGNDGLAKNGPGRLVLANGNSLYTGPIAINGGILEVGGGIFTVSRGTATAGNLTETFNVGTAGRVGNGDYEGAITIAADAEFFYNSTSDTILVGNISGDGVLNKGRSGILTLSGSNTFTGGTTVTGGVLLALAPSALPGYDQAESVVFAGGTVGVRLGGSGWATGQVDELLANATKAAGALGIDTTNGDASQWTALTTTNLGLTLGLTKLGDNIFTLNQANSYTGATRVRGGFLALSGAGTLGTGTNDLVLEGGSLDLGGLGATAGAVTITAAAASGATITAGNLTGSSYTAANPTGNAVIAANLLANGSAGFSKSGAGTVTLGGANTYTGETAVDAGALIFSTAGSASTDVTVAGDATCGVLLASAGGQAFNTGNLTLADDSTLRVDFGSAAPSTSVAPMKVANFASGAGHTVRIAATSYAGLAVGQSYPLLTWTGSGPADASAFGSPVIAHRVDGALSVTGKSLSLTMAYNAPGPVAWNTGNGVWDSVANHWLDSAGAATTFIDTLDVVVFGDAPGVTGNPVVTLDGTLSPASVTMSSTQRDYSITGSGGIGGSGSLTLDSANTRTLGIGVFANAYSGDTVIDGGTLRLLDFDVIPHGAGRGNVVVNGTLDLNDQDETINGLSGTGVVDTIAGGAPILTVGSNNATSTFGGVIRNSAGDLALTKTGTGMLTLTGANTYSGGTTISGGGLQIGDGGTSGSIGSGAVVITSGTLDFNLSSALDFGNDISGAGGVRQIGAGTTTLSALNIFSGPVTVSAGQLILADHASSSMGTVTVSGTGGAVLGITGDSTCNLGGNSMFVGTGTASHGTVNQTGGAVSFTSGNALLIGNQTSGNGTYNLSAGTLTTYASATRGVMIGVNSGCAGTFNLSGTGDLLAGHLAVGRNDAVSTDCTVAFNQTGGIATVTNLSVGGYSGATNTTATFSLTGGVFAATTFQNLTGAASSTAQITLGGSAEVTLPAFPAPAGTATVTFDFTTGSLSPAAASGSYMNGLASAFLTANGAAFDVPAGRDITVGQALQDAPAQQGTLRKLGEGALVLAGPCTYTGDTVVSEGSLRFSTAATSTTNVTVAAGGAAGAQAAGTDGQWVNAGSLTVASGGTLDIAYGSINPSSTTAPVKVTDFAVGSGAGVRITGGGFAVGQSYPLVTWTGNGPANASAFTVTEFPGLLGNLTVSGNTLFLNVTGLLFLSWNTGDGDWDTVTPNWVDNSFAPVAYADGDAVVFGDAAGATGNPVVTLGSPVAPSRVTMNSTARDYTISGGGAITGSATLALAPTNTGTLTVSTANSFTGGVQVGGGILRVGNNQALGANGGTITVAPGATLDFNGSQTASRDYHAVIAGSGAGAAGAVVNTGGNHNFGLRSLTLANHAAIGGTGRFDVRPITAGTGLINLAGFTLTKTGTNTVAIVDSVMTEPGSIQVNQGILGLTRNTISGDGSIAATNGATVLFENNTTGSFNKALVIDSAVLRVIGSAVTTAAPVSFTGSSSVQPVVNLTLNGEVSGDGAITKTETGLLALNAANPFSGTITVASGVLAIGHTAALANCSGITLAGGTTLRPDVADAVTGAPITLGASGTTATINAPTVVGAGGTTPVPFVLNGPISGDGNLIVNGTQANNAYGTIVLNAASTYTGSTLMTCSGSTDTQILVHLGADNALPATTVLTMDGGDGTGSGRTTVLDLKGHSQTLAGLTNVTRTLRTQRIVNTSATSGALTINNSSNFTFSGLLGTSADDGRFSLTKGGPGLLSLTGGLRYTGDTTVSGGTLSLGAANPNNDVSAVTLASPAKLQLTYAGTDTVGKLFLGAVQQAAGVYGHTDSGADNGGLGVGALDDYFAAGAGTLTVTSGPGTGGYAAWKAINAPATGDDPNADEDGDGVPNGIEYVLGGTIATNDLDKLPAVASSGGNLVFTFERDQASIGSDITVAIEVGTTLATWPDSYPVPDTVAANDPGVTVVKNQPSGFDTVILTVPQAGNASKFARLRVTVAP